MSPARTAAALTGQLLTLVLLTLVLLTAGACGGRSGTAPPGLVFGTLGSHASAAAAENAAGVRGATLELDWGAYEPSPGAFSASYVSMIKQRMRTFRAAGQQLTLALGLHHHPAWVRDLPDAVAVDQHGNRLAGIDMVFSQPVRDAAAGYFRRIDADLGIRDFAHIRLTSGGNAEMLYNTAGSYAAFSTAAQNGPTMAAGLPPNPVPGWRPGDRDVTTARVGAWADWYVNALADVTRWQIARFEAMRFTGTYQAITPGSGVRPDAYAEAVAQFLPDGLLGIGGAWHRYYASLAGTPRLMSYVSSLADGSGGDDGCRPADRDVPVTDHRADGWSAARWQSRLADEYGFAKGGENPGYGDGVAKGAHYADPSDRGMLAVALRQAVDCRFDVFNLAHDEQLWRGPLSLDTYAEHIRAAAGTR
ncbi:hypothetical protein GCM10010172_02620 [Paractinoplanes ferrugineus]|uniref:Glycoside hydrolase family 42 N-terminal domain-containing protein n=1 Tax=Paractinoplanes ferrugineus TaxID=113564 RepID=A0A919MMW0_9ACTN|nr:hypothetical protein [Actinoplanes ferrugineus]GIE13667.1 hypothetical protein Afe05nite_55070 [Actinoplanes ferrugineus]